MLTLPIKPVLRQSTQHHRLQILKSSTCCHPNAPSNTQCQEVSRLPGRFMKLSVKNSEAPHTRDGPSHVSVLWRYVEEPTERGVQRC